jgi:hypothetical protein
MPVLVPDVRLDIPKDVRAASARFHERAHGVEEMDPIMAAMPFGHVVGAYALGPGDATEARRIEPRIHDGYYRWIERFDGGYLIYGREREGKANFLSLDARGEAVTGAAKVSGEMQDIGPNSLAAGHLWLFEERTRAGSAPLRVLDARTLVPVGGAAFTILDRTQEAQTAWLPSPDATAPVEAAPPVPDPPAVQPDPNNLAFTPPPWDMAPVHAKLHALGYTDPFELLAWASHTRGVLMVAHVLDAEGPRWTLVALTQNGADGADAAAWDADNLDHKPRTRILRRRATPTDLEDHLWAIGLPAAPSDRPKNAPVSSSIDARIYIEVTGEPPRWRARATPKARHLIGP